MVINKKDMFLSIFFIMSFLMLVIMIFFGSTALGTFSIATLFLLYTLNPIKLFFSKDCLLICSSILFFIFIISILSFMQHQYFQYKRFISSYFLLTYLILVAYIVTIYLKKIESLSFYKSINSIFYLLLFDGVYSTIKFIFIGDKKTIFFSEPSHLALFILPFFLFKLISNKQVKSSNLFIIISMLFIALFFQNITLLVGIAIAIFVISKPKYFTFSFLLILSLITFTHIVNVDYFLSRLMLGSETQNLSALVFLSGWERAVLNLKETYGVGLGFNQLGYIGVDGKYMNIIYNLIGFKLNYNDGGTTGSKIISELGIFGLIILVVYSFFAMKSIYFLKNKFLILDNKDIFFLSIFIMYSIELFLRGEGYFNPTSFLFLISIFYLSRYIYKKNYLGKS